MNPSPFPVARLGALVPTLVRLGHRAKVHGSRTVARAAFAAAHRLDPHNLIARREHARLRPRNVGERHGLRFVAIGTTGVCNASCIHCPTGKLITAHVPRTTMDMAMFRGIIDEIVVEGWEVHCINFGLFGDGLVDPLVVDRVRYVRDNIPEVMLDVNTNGAAFNSKRHSPLVRDISLLTLHCESIRSTTYDRLMAPLRAANVFAKFQEILDTFAGKVRVSVPVNRLNLSEIEETRDWFIRNGAREVVFDPLASRCTDDQTLFRDLALAPSPIRCAPDIMDDLIVDCDGTVLACCQDFQRRVPIGDLSAGLRAALDDPRRSAFHQMLAGQKHATSPTCSRCNADLRTPDFPFDQVLST